MKKNEHEETLKETAVTENETRESEEKEEKKEEKNLFHLVWEVTHMH